MFKLTHRGNFNNIERFFNFILKKNYRNIVDDYARKGLEALREATPEESGATANAWNYTIEDEGGVVKLIYTNSHENGGYNVAILIMYGHGTRNGGYVEGNDFVNPAIQPIFQELKDALWREVTR